MGRRGLATTGVLLALLLSLATVAGDEGRARAHELPVDVTTVVEQVTPPAEGLTVEVVSSVAPQLVATNQTGRPVEVLDDDGRPFLRLDGEAVSANVDVAAWHRSNDPFGAAPVPERASDGVVDDEWVEVARTDSWGWFDHRLHPGGLDAGDGPGEPGDVLARWTVSLRVGDVLTQVEGAVVRTEMAGSYRTTLVDTADLRVAVLDGPAPGVLVQGGVELLVLGTAAEPLLRFGPGGTEANLASPTWHDVARVTGAFDAPEVVADASAEPVWSTVSEADTYAWVDPRMRVPLTPPDDPSFETVVGRWAIPVVAGGDEAEVAGEVRWVPAGGGPAPGNPDGDRGPLLLVAAGVAAVLLLALVPRLAARRSS